MGTLNVYCDDTSTRGEGHSGREVKVASLTKLAGEWLARTGNRFAGPERAHKAGSGALDSARATEKVRGDGTLIPNEGLDYDHLKIRLRCDLCGLDYQFAEPRVAPTLDRLDTSGVDRISLTQLARLLS